MHSALIISDLTRIFTVGGQNFCIPATWRRDSHASVKCVPPVTSKMNCCSTRRIPICRVQPLDKESENSTQGNPSKSDPSSSNHGCDSIDEEASNIGTSFDWGWLPAFQHTFVASISNFLFGYHIGAEANSLNEMILGRFLVGLGIGASTALVPIYISEVSPTKYRGALGTMPQLATCFGIIGALTLGIPCETDSHWWRVMFRIASLAGFLLIVGMHFAAESPRWLGNVGWKMGRSQNSHF